MTTPITPTAEPNKNSKPSDANVRCLRMLRVPLLLGVAAVAYEAVRLPLTAGPLTASTDQSLDQPAVTDAVDQQPTDHDHDAAVAEMLGLAGTETEIEVEPASSTSAGTELVEDTGDQGVLADHTLLALNAGGTAVGDLVGTLADGFSQDGNEEALFGSEVEDLVADTVVAENSDVASPRQPELLVLINPSEFELGYLMDGELRVLGPGQRHEIEAGPAREIAFHRGGDFGEADYQLSAGVYEFRVGQDGWELGQ